MEAQGHHRLLIWAQADITKTHRGWTAQATQRMLSREHLGKEAESHEGDLDEGHTESHTQELTTADQLRRARSITSTPSPARLNFDNGSGKPGLQFKV